MTPASARPLSLPQRRPRRRRCSPPRSPTIPSLVEAGGAWPVTTIRLGLPWWRV
jgi:hypothetical protein